MQVHAVPFPNKGRTAMLSVSVADSNAQFLVSGDLRWLEQSSAEQRALPQIKPRVGDTSWGHLALVGARSDVGEPRFEER
jgi:hypothetical protein